MACVRLRVRNRTPILQSLHGEFFPVGEWVTAPLPDALSLVRKGVLEVDPESARSIAIWKRGGKFFIHWLSPFSCGDGYATAAEAIITGLLSNPKVDVDVKCCWFMVERGLLPLTVSAIKKESVDFRKVGICLATPGEFTRLPTDYRIGWTMYEATDPLKANPEWRHQCNAVDELWVPTAAIYDIFGKFVQPSKLRVMPLALSQIYRDGRSGWKPDPDGCFRISTWGGLSDRKSPIEILDIFKKVFPFKKYPDVRITFKTRCGLFGKGIYNLPREADPRVRIIDDTWLPSKMVELGQLTDLFVFPTKGEGFGLPPREAILLGVPTIVTKSTGMLELENRNVWMVPVKKQEESLLGGVWDVPDWGYYADLLRWHYDNRRVAKQRALKASNWLWELRSPHAVSNLIIKRFESLDPDEEARKRELRKEEWKRLYHSPLSDGEVTMLLEHHDSFFREILRVTYRGATLLEVGVGGGATTYGLIRNGFFVIGIDNDETSIKTAAALLRRYEEDPPIVRANAFNLSEVRMKGTAFSAAVSQGFFEHFEDVDIRRLIREQLKVARVVVFSVPSIHYPTLHTGDERLMTESEWRRILEPFEVSHVFSYGGPGNRWHFCVTITGESLGVRGSAIKYL